MSPKRENTDVCDDSVKNDVGVFVRVSGADSSSEKQNMVNIISSCFSDFCGF